MGARADRISHRVCARVAGVSLVRAGVVFRPAGVALQGRPAECWPAQPADGSGADFWQLLQQRQTVCRAHRARFAGHRRSRALGPTHFALASEIVLGGERLLARDAHAERFARRQRSPFAAAVGHVQDWNAALPQLELRDVNLDLRRGDGLRRARLQCAVAAGARRHAERSSARRAGRSASAAWIGAALASARGISLSRMAGAAAGISDAARCAARGAFEVAAQRPRRGRSRARISIFRRRAW